MLTLGAMCFGAVLGWRQASLVGRRYPPLHRAVTAVLLIAAGAVGSALAGPPRVWALISGAVAGAAGYLVSVIVPSTYHARQSTSGRTQ
jgi:hypothetical protein